MCFFNPALTFSVNASVISTTEAIKTKTVIVIENEKIWLQLVFKSSKNYVCIDMKICITMSLIS